MEPDFPLRDIHLPQAGGWWPPAVGWWLLLLLVLLFTYGLYRAYRHYTRSTPSKQAVQLLSGLRQNTSMSPLEKIQQLSILLRRLALSEDGRSDVAGLNGVAWLHYLDQSMPGTPFTQGPGKMLAEAPFRKEWVQTEALEPLFQLSEQWIKAQQ